MIRRGEPGTLVRTMRSASSGAGDFDRALSHGAGSVVTFKEAHDPAAGWKRALVREGLFSRVASRHVALDAEPEALELGPKVGGEPGEAVKRLCPAAARVPSRSAAGFGSGVRAARTLRARPSPIERVLSPALSRAALVEELLGRRLIERVIGDDAQRFATPSALCAVRELRCGPRCET